MNKIVVIQYNFREIVIVGDDKIDYMQYVYFIKGLGTYVIRMEVIVEITICVAEYFDI